MSSPANQPNTSFAPSSQPQAESQAAMPATTHSLQFRVLATLIAAASCFRVFVCFNHNPMNYVISDMARHWLNGVRFPMGGYHGAADPIVYQAYISLLHHLTRDNRFLIALAASLLSVLMPWTFYRAARNFGLAKVPSLWVWLLIAWTPSLITIYHYIMMETLLLLLEGVALWMTARYLRKGGREAFLTSIFFWTLASLTKPTVVPLAGICFLWSWWKRSTPLREIALAAVMAVIMLVPQAIRTKVELGFVAPFGNPWMTKLILRSGARTTTVRFFGHANERLGFVPKTKDVEISFISPSINQHILAPFSSWTIRRAWVDSRAYVVINSSRGEQDWKDAYNHFNSDRNEWLAQWRENIVLFFFAPSWPECEMLQWDDRLEGYGRWLWAPLILFVFVGNVREFLRRRFDLIPVAAIVFTLILALQNVVLTEGRYRKPLEPLLFLNLVWIVKAKDLHLRRGKDDEGLRQLQPADAAV